jgi:hypothetical protein
MSSGIFRMAVDTPNALRRQNEKPSFFPMMLSFR